MMGGQVRSAGWKVAVALIWVVALFVLLHILRQHEADPKTYATPLVGYVAALIAFAGWLIQARLRA